MLLCFELTGVWNLKITPSIFQKKKKILLNQAAVQGNILENLAG